jgi:hypothetical protein
MAKLKEVRALKASGVEPLAPTLIKRILHNLVLKAEDRRWDPRSAGCRCSAN